MAFNCINASNPIGAAICRDPLIGELNYDLNHDYVALRKRVTSHARIALQVQQQAWLAERNRECASGSPDCLIKLYNNRLDQLKAISANADVTYKRLNDIRSAFLKGTWKASSVKDSTPAADSDASLQKSLLNAGLPAIGCTFEVAPGKLCLPQQPCDRIGLRVVLLSTLYDGWSTAQAMELPEAIPVFTGRTDSKYFVYLLIPRSDGTLWAMFYLCGPNATNCHHAAEVWTPVSADAAVFPPPIFQAPAK